MILYLVVKGVRAPQVNQLAPAAGPGLTALT